MKQPLKRSRSRKIVGKWVFTALRWLSWVKRVFVLSRKRIEQDLPFTIATHRTPLRREFSDSDERLIENKIVNISKAIRRLDGLVLKPGKIFSYWYVIGDPTKRKGYVSGMMLNNGKVVEGIGGGLCQLSNLIFWMTLHTPLLILERWRHGYDVFPDANRTQPFGSGATCYYPFLDLVVENSSKAEFQLRLRIENGYLVGEWRSDQNIAVQYEIVERDHRFEGLPWGGWARKNTLVRLVIDKESGELLREEKMVKNEAITMYNPLISSK